MNLKGKKCKNINIKNQHKVFYLFSISLYSLSALDIYKKMLIIFKEKKNVKIGSLLPPPTRTTKNKQSRRKR